MALTLRTAITAEQTVFDVLGADELQAGDFKTLDSETVVIRTATPATLDYGETARQRVTVYRGTGGTRAAVHDAGATLADWSGAGGGGSGLTVTVDEQGTYVFAPESGDPNLKLVGSPDSNDVLTITDSDHPEEINFGIDAFGYVSSTSGASFNPNSNVTGLQVIGGPSLTSHDIAQFADSGGYKFRLTFDGRVLLPDLPTSDPGVAGQVYADGVPSAGVPKVLKISGG